MDNFSQHKDTPAHVTHLARKFRKTPTKQEAILWNQLSKRKFLSLKFRRQHPIGRYIADFYNHDYKLVVEVDGYIHNQTKEYDKNRDLYFVSQKITILRVSNIEVETDISEVLRKISSIITTIKAQHS